MDGIHDQGADDSAGEPDLSKYETAAHVTDFGLPRRRRRLGIAVAGTAIIVVVGAVVVLRGPVVPGSGIAPAAFVTSATQATLLQRTVDLTFGGSVSAAGQTVPITGSGVADLTSNEFAATVDISVRGQTFVERELLANGQFFMAMTSGGQDIVSTLIPGKNWVQIPIPLSADSSVGTGTTDPLAELKLLAAQGNSVKSLGTKTIDGILTSGYAVTPSRQNFLNAEQKTIPSMGLNAAQQQQLLQEARALPIPTIAVWFDASKLLHQMSFVISQSQNGKTLNINLVMDLVNFGAPVSITVPASNDVASYSQFLSVAQQAAGTGG